jgi:hypothetical protein
LDLSGKKGILVGYCEVSKAFRIYILGYHHIEINIDVTFEEEHVAPRVAKPVREVTVTHDAKIPEDHDIT